MRRWQKVSLIVVGSILVLWLLLVLLFRPSTDREWNTDQDRLPTATFDGDLVTIRNVRDFAYENTTSYNASWREVTINLSEVESTWFMVERFDAFRGLAHTLVSFGFKDGSYLAVSAEIRKEKGESFSPVKGLLRQYELMYVVATERDVIGLRTNHRKDDVWLYPIRATPEQSRAMLTSMLERANHLSEDPEFYNTATNTCTTNIKRHVDELSPIVPRSWRVLLPGYVDKLVFDLDLIATDAATIEEARDEHYITPKAQASTGEFSEDIRAN